MPRFNLRLRITALVLAAVLALPWAAAAAPGAGKQPAEPGLLGQIWLLLTNVWGTGVTPDSGCHWDPSGHCSTGSAVPVPAITPDDGCRMDPNGGCLPGS